MLLSTNENPPSLTEWKALYEQTAKFKEISPWRWMWDSNLFGVKNPESGETGYCCVLGAAGEVFGLALYKGCEGLDGYWKAVHHPELMQQHDAIHLKKCLLLTFDHRSDLEKPDLQIIKELGLTFKGANAYPLFRSYEPGLYPWYLTDKEARFLILCLEQANELTLRFKADPGLFDSPKPDHYFVRVQEENSRWNDQWLQPAPLKRIVQITKSFDSRRLEKIMALPSPEKMIWEIDYFYSPSGVGKKGERPYFPMTLLLVDQHSFFVLNVHLFEPPQFLVELHEHFLKTIEKADLLPEAIWVQKEDLYAYLQPLAEKLGIRMHLAVELPAASDVRKSMLEFFARPG